MNKIKLEEFKRLAKKAQVPEKLVLETVKETVEAVKKAWGTHKASYPLSTNITGRIDAHIKV